MSPASTTFDVRRTSSRRVGTASFASHAIKQHVKRRMRMAADDEGGCQQTMAADNKKKELLN